jgi:hypothetical protein
MARSYCSPMPDTRNTHVRSRQGRETGILTSPRQSPAGIQRTTRKLRLRGEVSMPSPETWIDLPSI